MLGELEGPQIERLLHEGTVGRIGCHAGGRTYVVPVSYVYDGTAVYAHSAEGQKLRMMRENPEVCFEVDSWSNLANWQSVIAWGRFEELSGDAAKAAMQLLVSRFLPLMTSETATPSHGLAPSSAHGHDAGGRRASLFRIVLGEKTGRFEKR